ncbi:DUF4189 domain-containing protein [Nocardia sp. NPDC049707]|uniref:DUF4189 domain-containing protein n=1 Tax=Nocardia sp. NPDC049707 TaxID=3154735 RepID=UPI003419A2FF
MKFTGKAVVAVAAVGLAAGAAIGAGPANAASLHGAIAFSAEDWIYGTAVDAMSPDEAIDAALANCSSDGASDCVVMVTWSDGCGALVYSDDAAGTATAVGTGAGRDRATALRGAYASLAEYYPLAMLANVGSADMSQTGISEVVCTGNA